MNRFRSMLVGVAICSVSLSVWAATWTSYFTIDYLDNNDGAGGIVYKVYSASGNMNNPAGCGSADYALMNTAAAAEARELMSRTLLGAFLAGRKVRLHLSDLTCSSTSPTRPIFGAVSVDKDQ
jgi:hypothetical protein